MLAPSETLVKIYWMLLNFIVPLPCTVICLHTCRDVLKAFDIRMSVFVKKGQAIFWKLFFWNWNYSSRWWSATEKEMWLIAVIAFCVKEQRPLYFFYRCSWVFFPQKNLPVHWFGQVSWYAFVLDGRKYKLQCMCLVITKWLRYSLVQQILSCFHLFSPLCQEISTWL